MSLQGDIDKEKDKLAEQIRESIVDALVAQNPIPLATGRLASSIEVVPTEDGFDILAEDWWKYVEYGRQGRGKFPPIQPIMEWISAKGIKPKTPNTSPSNLAWAIATKLKTSNIKPRPFLQQGIDAVGDEAIDKLGIIISKAIDETFE